MAASGSIEGVTLTRIGRPADTACQLGSAVLVDVRVADPAGRRGCTKPDSPARQLMHRKRRSPAGFLVLCSLGAIHWSPSRFRQTCSCSGVARITGDGSGYATTAKSSGDVDAPPVASVTLIGVSDLGSTRVT